jgi:YVTN family beta-propeller protein
VPQGDAASLGAMSNDPRIGSELAGYRVEALLGRGGMGVVYRAHDLALDRPVALKILAPELAEDVRFRERFLRESRLAASLDHRSIVPVHDAGEVAGELYIAMRYVEGSDLKAVLREQGALAPARALEIVEQVADALDAAHERGLVHRDVKPSNVLIDAHGHCYLADFGLSRRLGDAGAALGATQSLGTADYVAPEQIRGEEVDGRADLYSLGCLMHECLTGEPPFKTSSDAATLFAHLEQEPPAPPGLEHVMRTALAKDPDERFQSGRELVEAARSGLGLEPKRVRWPLAVAAVGLALIGAALLAFFLTSGGGGGPASDPGADSLVRIDPRTNKVAETMAVGRLAGSVAADSRYVWVTSTGDGTVWRIDAKTGSVLKLAAHGTPTALGLGGGKAILADAPEHKIVSLDAATGAVGFTTTLANPGANPLPVAAGPDGVWFADVSSGGSTGLVEKIDDILASGSPSAQIAIPGNETTLVSSYFFFDGLAAGDGALWLAGDARERVVWRVDPNTHRVVARIRLPFIPKAIAAGSGAVWVTSLLGDTVSRIDPRTNRIVATIPVGRGPDSIAAADGAVWVTSAIDDALWRIDPRTNRVVAHIPLHGIPRAVAIGAGGVWVTTTKPAPPAPKRAIKIGVYADCQGAYGSAHNDSLRGAELPLVERGGRLGVEPSDGVSGVSVGGRPIRLYFGCDATDGGSSTAQTLAETRRLVEQVGVDILIAPTNTPDELALQQYARIHPHTTFVDGAGAAPDPNPAPNFFKFNTNGAQWMAGLGAYAYRTLGWRRAVTVVSAVPDAFWWAQLAAFDAEFCSLGGTIAKRVWYPPTLTDYSTVVAQVPSHGVDGVVVDYPPVLLALATADPQLRGNLSRKVVLTSIGPQPSLYPLGARAAGILAAGPTLLLPGADARPGLAPGARYRTEFTRAFPRIPKFLLGFFDVPYYNAMAAALQALDEVHGDLSGGEKRFMAALAKVTLDAPNGRISLDSKHLGIGPNYVWQLQGPKLKPVVIRTIPRVDASFGGYFKPTDPPPSKATPACVKRTPPPWAR